MSENKIRVQSRRWSIIFWVDDLALKDCEALIMEAIKKMGDNHTIKYAFILHDQDIYTADEYLNYANNNLGELPSWQVGDKKPSHYHIYIESDSRLDLTYIFRMFDNKIPLNYIKRINNDSMYIRYLVHCDNPEKYQYSEFAVISNIPNIDLYFIDKNYSTCERTNFVRMLLDYFDSPDNVISFGAISKWCLENGFSEMLLKHSYWIRCLVDDYLDKIKRLHNKAG